MGSVVLREHESLLQITLRFSYQFWTPKKAKCNGSTNTILFHQYEFNHHKDA